MGAAEMELIAKLRGENYSYQYIANQLGMPMNTVKSICRRHRFAAYGPRKTKQEKKRSVICKNCHRPLDEGLRMDAMFCSGYCRKAWQRRNRRVCEQ